MYTGFRYAENLELEFPYKIFDISSINLRRIFLYDWVN